MLSRVVFLVTLFLSCSGLSLPHNKGYNLLSVEYFAQGYEEFRANDGKFLNRLDNSVLVTPRDIKAYDNTYYVTGLQYDIQMYDQTTLEYKGSYLEYDHETQILRFLDNHTKLGVIVYDVDQGKYSIDIYEYQTKDLLWNVPCPNQCFDFIQNEINGNILVATKTSIDQYAYQPDTNSWEFVNTYLDYSSYGTQSRTTLQWVGGYLYVGLDSAGAIFQYTPTATNATLGIPFVTEPLQNWNLFGFDFYPGSTTDLVATGWAGEYQGYLYKYNASGWTPLASADLEELVFVGTPANVYFDDQGNLLVPDFGWITRWNSSTGAFKDQIIHQEGLVNPLGISVNPSDPQYAYITTGNRVLKIERNTSQAIEVFIPRVLSDATDGTSIGGRLRWYENWLWVQAFQYLTAFNKTGQQVKQIVFPENVNDFKISPLNGKLYATAYDSAKLYEVDLTTSQVTLVVDIPVQTSFLAFSNDGSLAYVNSDWDCTGVTAYDTTTWSVYSSSLLNLIDWGTDIEVGPDGNVYLQYYAGIFVLEGETLEAIGTLTQPMYNYRGMYLGDITFAPDYKDVEDGGKKKGSSLAIGVGVGVGAGGLLVAVAGFIAYKRRTKKVTSNPEVPLEQVSIDMHKFWEIDFAELEIGDEIGRGAFGSVFKGEWRNSYCVVKQLQITSMNKEAIAVFLKEANTVKMLRNHRNVCTIFGVCTNPEKQICIVMEYCNGGNLQSALINKKIIPTLPNLVRIFKDITSGMSHVHREGIVHCDLASRNMLVSLEGNGEFAIKISDFGFARVLPTDGVITVSEEDKFPIRWSAPELLRDKLLSRAADVWSFGVVMWETIEGATPYGTLNNFQVIECVCDKHATLEEPARIASGQLPKVLYSIMQKCWNPKSEERPSFEDLIKEFKELEKDSKVTQSFLTHDGVVDVPFWSKDSQQTTNTNHSEHYGNAPSDKTSRYCNLVRPKPDSSGSDTTDPNLAYGNKNYPQNSV